MRMQMKSTKVRVEGIYISKTISRRISRGFVPRLLNLDYPINTFSDYQDV
jgi:hypothetical protein